VTARPQAKRVAGFPIVPGWTIVCLIMCVTLAACDRAPWFAPPEQRPSLAGFPSHAGRVVEMESPDADRRIVRDILPLTDTAWRWTGQRPALRIRVRADENLKYVIDFTLPKVTFKDTGPVSIAFTVNDRLLDRVRYTEPGFKHFEKAVPPDWLPIDAYAIVGAEIDKLWIDPDGGRKYGFIVTRMGLTQ
jgi:hypothetical protein